MRRKWMAGITALSLCAATMLYTTAYALEEEDVDAAESGLSMETVSQEEEEENVLQTTDTRVTEEEPPEDGKSPEKTENLSEAAPQEELSLAEMRQEDVATGETMTETEPENSIREGEDIPPETAQNDPTEQTENSMAGDVDSDGIITPRDRVMLSRYLEGWEAYEKMVDFAAADVNRDGQVDSLDLDVLRAALLGESASLVSLQSE